jgi:LPXTG-site transpeptidase (sortase) family protein
VLTCTANGAAVTIGATTGSFTVTSSVTPSAAGSLPNTATVDPNNVVNEAVEGNNTGSDTVAVVGPPTIAKAFTPDSITVGGTSTLQFTLTNTNSGAALTGVAFSDTLPAGVTVASSSSAQCGGTLTVTAPSTIALSGGTIAASGSCVFDVTVTGSTTGAKLNTSGAVSSTNGGTGGTASDTLTVSAAGVSDPAVTKTGTPDTAQVGDTVTFTVVVRNLGTADAANVELTDEIPTFLDISSVMITPSGPSPSISGNIITINFGTLTPGQMFTVTITTVVNSLGAPPGGINTANLTPLGSNPGNNSASFSLTIVTLGALEAPETGFTPNRTTIVPIQPVSAAYFDYGGLWLEIPAVGAKMQIVGVPLQADGWDVTWLSDQAGYLAGTAFPTWNGNSVITGHATLPSGGAGPFARLQELRYGDRIVVEAWGMRYSYEVRAQDLVRPDAPSIFRHEELAWVTLITCADFDERTDSYRSRRLVRAVLMSVETSD